MNNLFKRREILLNGLIHKDIPVGKIQYLTLHTAFQQTVHDLKRSIGLARACCHNKQKPCYTTGNRIDSTVYCYTLIISRLVGILA